MFFKEGHRWKQGYLLNENGQCWQSKKVCKGPIINHAGYKLIAIICRHCDSGPFKALERLLN